MRPRQRSQRPPQPRFEPEARGDQIVAMRGADHARAVVLGVASGLLGLFGAGLAGVAGVAGAAAGWMVVGTLVGLVATTLMLGPRSAACAVRRAALATVAKIGAWASVWLAVPHA